MSTQTDRIAGLSGGLALKAPVHFATTGPITLSGVQTVDGVFATAGMRGLVKDQANPVENGIYDVSATGWRRSKDFDGARDVVNGTTVRVTDGMTNAGRTYSVTTADPVIFGTSQITFELVSFGSTILNQTVVSTVAYLKLLSASTSTVAQVLDYAVAGDNGGGLYRSDPDDTTTADETFDASGRWTIVDASGTRWKLSFTDGVCPLNQIGVDMTGATAMQAKLNAVLTAGHSVYVPTGTLLINGLVTVPSTFHGRIYGPGTIKSEPGVARTPIISMSGVSDVEWSVDIDMGQDETTVEADDKAEIGLDINNCRRVRIHDCRISACRLGRPIYIRGTSSTSPADSHGSQDIWVENVVIDGIAFSTVDLGCYCIIASTFYTGTNGGLCEANTNGVKLADYTVDETVTYPATTKRIYVKDCTFLNCDRFAVLNADYVHFSGCNFHNFFTRGINVSPTCSNGSVNDCSFIGGSATTLSFAYCCHHWTINNVHVDGNGSQGQKAIIRPYLGCTDFTISNITGYGAPDRHIYMHSVKRITISNVNLRAAKTGTTTYAIDISAAEDGSTTTWTTEDITIANCNFRSQYGFVVNLGYTGTPTIAPGGIRIRNVKIEKTFQLIQSSGVPTAGELDIDGLSTNASSTETLNPMSFRQFRGSDYGIDFVEAITLVADNVLNPTWTTLGYYAPKFSASSANKNPDIQIWRERAGTIIPLFHGVHYTVESSDAGTMTKRIRMVDTADAMTGDVFTMVRLA